MYPKLSFIQPSKISVISKDLKEAEPAILFFKNRSNVLKALGIKNFNKKVVLNEILNLIPSLILEVDDPKYLIQLLCFPKSNNDIIKLKEILNKIENINVDQVLNNLHILNKSVHNWTKISESKTLICAYTFKLCQQNNQSIQWKDLKSSFTILPKSPPKLEIATINHLNSSYRNLLNLKWSSLIDTIKLNLEKYETACQVNLMPPIKNFAQTKFKLLDLCGDYNQFKSNYLEQLSKYKIYDLNYDISKFDTVYQQLNNAATYVEDFIPIEEKLSKFISVAQIDEVIESNKEIYQKYKTSRSEAEADKICVESFKEKFISQLDNNIQIKNDTELSEYLSKIFANTFSDSFNITSNDILQLFKNVVEFCVSSMTITPGKTTNYWQYCHKNNNWKLNNIFDELTKDTILRTFMIRVGKEIAIQKSKDGLMPDEPNIPCQHIYNNLYLASTQSQFEILFTNRQEQIRNGEITIRPKIMYNKLPGLDSEFNISNFIKSPLLLHKTPILVNKNIFGLIMDSTYNESTNMKCFQKDIKSFHDLLIKNKDLTNLSEIYLYDFNQAYSKLAQAHQDIKNAAIDENITILMNTINKNNFRS